MTLRQRTLRENQPPKKPHSSLLNQPAEELVRLTDEQEEAMADWLKDNAVLYNKGKKEYRDVDKKDALWASQGRVMGISGEFC